MKCYKTDNQVIRLNILVKPGAKTSAIVGIVEGRLAVAIAARPVEGAANKELVNFLSKHFNIPKSKIHLAKGDQSRFKQVELPFTNSLVSQLDAME